MLDLEEIDFSLLEEDGEDSISHDQVTLNVNPEDHAKKRKKLQVYNNYWIGGQDFRDRRERSRKFLRGDQWYEKVLQDDGSYIREDELIASQGRTPIVNNQIRAFVKTLIGQFLENEWKPQVISRKKEEQPSSEMMTNALWAIHDLNNFKYLDPRVFEEFLTSGGFGWKLYNEWFSELDQMDIRGDAIDMTRIFWNNDIKDQRLNDLRCVGQIHDVLIEKVLQTFAKTPEDEKIIRGWYGGISNEEYSLGYESGSDNVDDIDFYVPLEPYKCRVFEVWEKLMVRKMIVHDTADGSLTQTDYSYEEIDQLNQERMQQALSLGVTNIPLLHGEEKMEEVWHYAFLTGQGEILAEGETPYEHQGHPFCLNLYPMLDGENWGFVEDLVDKQKAFNRYFGHADYILGTSGKNTLMVDTNATPTGWDVQRYAKEHTTPGGVIEYNSKDGGKAPHEANSNSTSAGAQQMLAMTLEMMKDTSGVQDALRGATPEAGTSGIRYNQQALNSSTSNKDYFETFYNGMKQRDFKLVQLAQQYYDEERNTNISGKDFEDIAYMYDPSKAKNTHYRVVIGKTGSTPAHRQLQDDFLVKLFETQAIDVITMLENSSFAFADKIIASIQQKQEQMQSMPQQIQ